MTPLLKYSLIGGAAAIGVAVAAFIAYKILKKRRSVSDDNKPDKHGENILYKPISLQSILDKAIFQTDLKPGSYELCVFPPSKSDEFISFYVNQKKAEKDDFYTGLLNLQKDANPEKLVVIWVLKQGDDIINQGYSVSDSLASDFMDAVPEDKIYVKKITVQ